MLDAPDLDYRPRLRFLIVKLDSKHDVELLHDVYYLLDELQQVEPVPATILV